MLYWKCELYYTMKPRHYIPCALCLLVQVADLARPGYGKFGIQNAVTPVTETATRAIARVEDYTPFTGVVKLPGCTSKPTAGYTGFSVAQWKAFKDLAKSDNIDKAVTVLGGKLCDAADGVILMPAFTEGKVIKIERKNGKLTHKTI